MVRGECCHYLYLSENFDGGVEKHFHKPDEIDERRMEHFVEEVMPNAPKLTEDEEEMLGKLGDLETALIEKGKRMRGTLKEDVDKFLWREGDKIWGGYGVTVDKAAEKLVAEVFDLDTYMNSKRHSKENGSLVRAIKKNVGGSRSRHFRVGKKLTALDYRLFENWYSWKENKLTMGE